jgi:hypothetical protein
MFDPISDLNTSVPELLDCTAGETEPGGGKGVVHCKPMSSYLYLESVLNDPVVDQLAPVAI